MIIFFISIVINFEGTGEAPTEAEGLLTFTHIRVYLMKRKDLERTLREMGWRIIRHGLCHDVWASDGNEIAVPRHNEIKKYTAKMIIKIAEEKKA